MKFDDNSSIFTANPLKKKKALLNMRKGWRPGKGDKSPYNTNNKVFCTCIIQIKAVLIMLYLTLLSSLTFITTSCPVL